MNNSQDFQHRKKENNRNAYVIKPYSLKELAVMYNVSKNTFKKWLEPINDQMGRRQGYYYNVHQVEIIFKYLGVPEPNKYK
jgi:transposase